MAVPPAGDTSKNLHAHRASRGRDGERAGRL